MYAILIDPFAQTVEPVEYSGHYKDIYRLLGENVDTFTAAPIGDRDVIFVDDVGLFVKDQAFFRTSLYPSQPLAGKGLVLGADKMGESTAPETTLEQMRASIQWGR